VNGKKIQRPKQNRKYPKFRIVLLSITWLKPDFNVTLHEKKKPICIETTIIMAISISRRSIKMLWKNLKESRKFPQSGRVVGPEKPRAESPKTR